MEHSRRMISSVLWQVSINIREAQEYLEELSQLAKKESGYRFANGIGPMPDDCAVGASADDHTEEV